MTEKKMGTGKKIGLGVGMVTAAALAGAAGYYLYGKDGAKHRKQVKTLAAKAHAEVLKRAKKLSSITKADYHTIVDAVEQELSAIKSIDKKDMQAVARDLKTHWNQIEKTARAKKSKLVLGAKKIKKSLKGKK